MRFELNFVCCEVGIQVIFLFLFLFFWHVYGDPIIPEPFLKKTILSPGKCLWSCRESDVFVCVFFDSLFGSIDLIMYLNVNKTLFRLL